MKKAIVFFLFWGIFCSCVWAGNNTMTLHTGYPSPYGSFSIIQLIPMDGAETFTCNIGTIYFDDGGQLKYCEDIGTGTGAATGPLWKRAGERIVFSDPPNLLTAADLFVGIGTRTPEFKLTLENDGAILAKGTFGSGENLQTVGAGTRLIWYPKKAAFRAGRVNSNRWNNSHIGADSLAVGFNTKASGEASVAMGRDSVASGDYTIAFGYASVSSGASSIAAGLDASATGEISVAIGRDALATEEGAIALGYSPEASGLYSIALGQEAKALQNLSIALGYANTATGIGAVAMGAETVASGNHAISGGFQGKAEGSESISFGFQCKSKGDYAFSHGYLSLSESEASIAIGNKVRAVSQGAVALGSLTESQGISSIAMGSSTNASGDYSVAWGKDTKAEAFASVAIGLNNVGGGDSVSWVDTDPLFEIGNGDNPLVPHNVLTILKNGKVGINTASPTSSLHIEGIQEYLDNAAAIAAGLTPGAFYRTGDLLKIVY